MKKFLILMAIFLIIGIHLSAQMKIYWVDDGTGKVQRANPDGSAVQDLVTGLTNPYGIIVDNINDKIYWGKGTSPGKIQRANLDGTGVVDLITGLGSAADISLDLANGKIYWTDSNQNKIQRANLDGSNIQDLLTGRSAPVGLGIDTGNGKMYWTERGASKICRANLDGSAVQDLITAGLSAPYGLELDLKNSKIYFSDFGIGKIQKANLDGSGVTDVLTGLGWDIDAITLDVDNSIIYYATYNTKIGKVNFNGTGNADVVTGLGLTSGVAFYKPTYTISGNAGAVGVTLGYTDGSAKTAISDAGGNYSFRVSYDWSGTVTPSLTGYTFAPVSRTYTNVVANQTSQDYTATAITYTISGNAGVAGATLSYTDGTPKTATADGSGNYSFTVSYNWSGTVTPSLTGYTFTPANRTYTNVLANQAAQNYTATAITYTISGNAGIAGATLSYTDGTPKTATADGSGNYSFTVSYNWSGTVTPSLTGYAFTPASRTYTNVLANQTAQDYTAAPTFFTISGNAGAAGVTLSYTDGTPKTATADGSGNYSFTVSYDWSGTVTPSLTGYTFTPASRTYTNVLANQSAQDYTANAITYTISGNAGIAGATLSYTDGTPKTATADGSGNYSFTVSYNWSGTVTPSLAGYTFTPANRTYTNVLSNQAAQDYTVTAITYTISGNAGIAGATLSYTDGTPKTATTDGSGNYSFTVSYNWSGTVTPSLTGYAFTPANRVYTNVLANQTSQDYTVAPIVYTISGNAGVAGATLSYTDGTPKTATADGSGNYSFTVSYNWSGTVTPSLTGYTFTPANRTYTNVLANQSGQDYTANAITYTISGNAGAAGVTLSYTDGIPKTATADGSGNYSFTVSYNWSGTVTPSLAGYTFTPANRTYTNVLSNQAAQDYTATAITYTISGNAGIAGATLSYTDGTPKTATADGSGNYSFTVSYNWSGTVTPSRTGYTFTPANRTYTNVLANQTNQDYTASAIIYTISGNAGVAGATLSYTDGIPKTATADGTGNYSFTVSYNWSGTVTPSLTGYTFTPANRTYTNVLADQAAQDYTATAITYTISGNAGIAGATLSYTDGTPKTATADGSGNYSFTVSYNWSGTVTPSLTGYTFTPANRNYTNVLANQAAQDYTATAITYTISGNAGVAGAILSYTDGTPKTATADGSGNYTFTVSYNWSGTVTPSLTGYTFTPANRTYANVLANQTNQDYTAAFNAPVATAATGIQSTSFYANWNAAAGAVGYRLDVATDAAFVDLITGYNNLNVGNVTTYLVNTNLNPGSRYYYRVRAYNSIETSGNSNTISLQTGPAATTAIAATAITQTSFSANWNPTAGVLGYRIDVATDAGFTAFVTGYNNLDVGNVTTYSVNTGLTPGTRYYYRVRTYNASGTGSNSNTISLITIPGDPTATAATNILSSSFSANWNAVTGATGYYLDAATDAGFTAFVTGYNNLDVGNVTTYLVTNLNPLTPYYYRVRAYNASGTSGNSNIISLTTIAAVPAVTTAAITQITYSSAKGGGNVTNDGGAAVTARGVCWSTSPTPTVADDRTVNGAGIGAFTSSLTGLQEYTIYYVRAYATNSSGTGYGQQVQFTTNAQAITITITAPIEHEDVSGTVIIRASVSSNLLVHKDLAFRTASRVEFYIDNEKIAEDTSAPYEASWDTTTVADGDYIIKAVAYNLAGQSSQDEILVHVMNVPAQPPHISLNRSKLNFGAVQGNVQTASQSILVDNTGGGTLHWTVTGDAAWLSVTPASGNGDGVVTAAINPAGLSIGTYEATISFVDADADNSPQTVAVKLRVYGAGSTNPAFGYFDTPVEGSIVMSSVPVTGWALDDIEAVSVKLFRSPIAGEGDSLVYIGDAIFVEGARPDMETLYPDYPFNYRAGWGYMLLTNFLPNGGNGTFTLHAVVIDKEGHETNLGTRTITCDNANAVKPFGAIDTPAQGGQASGTGFVNFGWALTPQPNTIPVNGSTIYVWVDGLPLGKPVYNMYREDIATLFPGYNNSNGAVGYYYLDTTAYDNGVHTIAWSVSDDAGNADGIGSRYFIIENVVSSDVIAATDSNNNSPNITQAPISGNPVYVRTGYSDNAPVAAYYPDQEGVITIKLQECERVEIRLYDNPAVPVTGSGYMEVGGQLRPLPIGSTFDGKSAIFTWQPGPGFIGEYRLMFGLQTGVGQTARKIVKIQIGS